MQWNRTVIMFGRNITIFTDVVLFHLSLLFCNCKYVSTAFSWETDSTTVPVILPLYFECFQSIIIDFQIAFCLGIKEKIGTRFSTKLIIIYSYFETKVHKNITKRKWSIEKNMNNYIETPKYYCNDHFTILPLTKYCESFLIILAHLPKVFEKD